MQRNNLNKMMQKGSMMVEALALLGLITMVTPILYRKAAERTTELQDINVASQMRMMSSAIDDYIKDNYNEVGETHAGEVFTLTDAELEKLKNYLPYGFDTQQSKLFEDFEISVRKRTVKDINDRDHHIYTTAVLAPLRDDITMMRASKIASMIGVNGGVYRRSMEAGEGEDVSYTLSGVQGTWEADPDDYNFSGDDIKEGSLVVISNKAISSVQGDVNSDEVLYRIDDGNLDKNTMQTTLYMDGHEMRGLSSLIAQGDTVSIGQEGDKESNLLVTGWGKIADKLDVLDDLTVEGSTSLRGDLDVAGETTLKGTTISGDLTQSGGDIDFDPDSFSLESKGAVKIDASGNTNIGGTNVTIAADTTAKIGVGGNGLTVDSGGNTLDGDTTINGDLEISGDLTAEWLRARTGITAGGEDGSYFRATQSGVDVNSGDLDVAVGNVNVDAGNVTVDVGDVNVAQGDVNVDVGDVNVDTGDVNIIDGALKIGSAAAGDANIYADGSTMRVVNPSFSVGGTLGTKGNKININSSATFIGSHYESGGNHKGLLVDASSLVLRNASGHLTMEDSKVILENTNAKVELTKDKATVTVSGESGTSSMSAVASKIGFENKPGSTTYSMYLDKGVLDTASKSIITDEEGIALGTGDISGIAESMAEPSDLNSRLLGSDDGTGKRNVAISREGIIELRAPTTSSKGGYIRARRLVSDVAYPVNENFHGYTASGADIEVDANSRGSKGDYDYYQVNPAYTSVMNDIKLATRGGARLSDILPDFINKGIYVVDNTYKETGTFDWNTASVTLNGGVLEVAGQPGECESNNCVASPWMGFVPAPQCPKEYAKVITLTPMRWRMSEVYSVYGTDLLSAGAGGTNYKTIITGGDGTGDAFKKYFILQTNPKNATFQLSTSDGGDSHTHTIESGYPLTFQTNTWLNTTISNVGVSMDEFKGWHAIMGFVYRPTQYRALLADIGYSNPDYDKVYWNIFPVYAQEMATVATVYCYFDRGSSSSWTWGNPVYKYDQLSNFRIKEKDENWAKTVNDPALGYTDAW